MPVIRFVREGCDVECFPGENLRDVALRSGVELYGLKGKLGNCSGCGQCITCFVGVADNLTGPPALSALTPVEQRKLRGRPRGWRLACQAMVEHSLVVLTRPQLGWAQGEGLLAAAAEAPLPAGPIAWPTPPEDPAAETEQSATADEAGTDGPIAGDTVR
ncbi:(2Fe-2S)-binding protein [Synechococcus sp. CS-1325]|uniref:2Fe-2S iron-sulfur cluster-binding protein n=1 Tax=unclassified Synechococcus TaxID=2626047 RepID=UPI000DB5290E|nr:MULTISPECIES: (2Fe-2S)-binding protein [unclassified Synechococcus]PZV00050.1 MAG: ferredoxin [Cyanobium sp.]MCT0198848.1 (2Fe-2S)-binding protein [Synechococcus sp. CS-1325]MCT0214060.1 (2Fe-2S)-binding protein [Synechococcus sp. CS-1326]MCT0231878.1 (2Fe-2S)-binding protein [Synechococcus sp. CS-1324]MCT0234147.1 (2Fe-2S)-binding protein [Synechococcus sp. CS-1327]